MTLYLVNLGLDLLYCFSLFFDSMPYILPFLSFFFFFRDFSSFIVIFLLFAVHHAESRKCPRSSQPKDQCLRFTKEGIPGKNQDEEVENKKKDQNIDTFFSVLAPDFQLHAAFFWNSFT